MSYNPDIHHRKSIRLKDYDYSQEGLYFITICTQNREKLFGEIVEGKMMLNISGQEAFNEWFELENRYKNIELHEFIVMPNHIHGIIEVRGNEGVINNARTENKIRNDENYYSKISPKSNSLSLVIRSYKACVTRKIHKNNLCNIEEKNMCKGVIYNAQDNNTKNKGIVWQRNYYENIIRNEEAHLKVREYINNNPIKWVEDRYYE